jgi:NAD(P)-dependent dehydrogenase (short-subunit alcohol dehydrogenase family)
MQDRTPAGPEAVKAKTWLITGASRGFGREFARAALSRGDNVAATARDVRALQALRHEHPELLALPLDVTDAAAVRDRVAEAEEHFGRLDVVVNNAGYGMSARRGASVPGDPAAAARALLEIVDAKEPPLRVLFGVPVTEIMRGVYERRLKEWTEWEDLTARAFGR